MTEIVLQRPCGDALVMPDHHRSSSRRSSSPRDLERLSVAGPSAGWRAMLGCIRDRETPPYISGRRCLLARWRERLAVSVRFDRRKDWCWS